MMSRRRERSRSPVHRREREKHDRNREEKLSHFQRNKDHYQNEQHREKQDDRHRHRQDHERRRTPDKKPHRDRDREERDDGGRRSRNIAGGDVRGDRRDGPRDLRQDRDRNEDRRDNRRPPHHRRDRRREREEEEPEDTSRYGQPAEGDGAENNTATDPEQPNFGLSGKLTEYTNTYKGVVIKYNEPPEARKPKTRWRLYPFKGEESLPVLYIHRQSAFLLGRQRHIADIPIDHPSCSKQHAVLQYKLADYERPDGAKGKKVKPYIIDLESANGTYLNNERIEPRRYYELKERDVLKFGFSSREYVMLHESSLNTEGKAEGSKSSSEEDESPE